MAAPAKTPAEERYVRGYAAWLLMIAFGVGTPVTWIASNALVAVVAGRVPPGWTWLALGLAGLPIGAVMGPLPVRYRAPRAIPWVAFVIVIAGLAMALAFNR